MGTIFGPYKRIHIRKLNLKKKKEKEKKEII